MSFVVDEMGNCWDEEDAKRTFPVMPHPELEGRDALCPTCGKFKYRVKLGENRFEWRCGCGEVFRNFHH